jgi:hypothetical protein
LLVDVALLDAAAFNGVLAVLPEVPHDAATALTNASAVAHRDALPRGREVPLGTNDKDNRRNAPPCSIVENTLLGAASVGLRPWRINAAGPHLARTDNAHLNVTPLGLGHRHWEMPASRPRLPMAQVSTRARVRLARGTEPRLGDVQP